MSKTEISFFKVFQISSAQNACIVRRYGAWGPQPSMKLTSEMFSNYPFSSNAEKRRGIDTIAAIDDDHSSMRLLPTFAGFAGAEPGGGCFSHRLGDE